jgi:hypothetical protein
VPEHCAKPGCVSDRAQVHTSACSYNTSCALSSVADVGSCARVADVLPAQLVWRLEWICDSETAAPRASRMPLCGALVTAVRRNPVSAYARAGLRFVRVQLFDRAARTLPGSVIRFGIDTMVSVIRGLRIGETSSVAKTGE